MKERKGSFATHGWELHKYLYITEKHRRGIYCDSSGCCHQVLTSILDDSEGTIYFGGNLIVKGVDILPSAPKFLCFMFTEHLLC